MSIATTDLNKFALTINREIDALVEGVCTRLDEIKEMITSGGIAK